MIAGWMIAFEGYDPADERRREALCSVGNGYLGVRGSAPESAADDHHYPGTYVAGVYNRLYDELDGAHLANESLVNLPSWLPLRLGTPGSGWFHPDRGRHALLEHSQWLDLRHGVLHRTYRFRDADGRTTRVEEQRIAHMAEPHLCALQVRVTAEDWSGELRISTAIDADPTNDGVPRYASLSHRHLDLLETGTDADVLYVVAQTSQSHHRVAVAAHTTVSSPDGAATTRRRTEGHRRSGPEQRIVVAVRAGTTVTIEKVAATHTSRDPAVGDPLEAAGELLREWPGFDAALDSHHRAWDALWEAAPIDLTPALGVPDDLLRNVRLGLFHLFQTVSPSSTALDVGLPARGLTGEAYRGHVFWDELLVLPALSLRLPSVARALLLYRHRRLPAARRAAAALGCRGACFPWQSGSDGRDETQRLHLNPASGRWLPDVTGRQRHVGLAVAVAAWRHVEATGDIDFLRDYAADLVLEVATFFGDLARFDPARGRFVIEHVVGPDEFHTGYPGRTPSGVDNNAYTNVMTAWVAKTALRVLALLPKHARTTLMHRHDLTTADLARWERLSRQMFVPFHDGVISQFEGYGDLPDLDWAGLRASYRDIRRLDRLLEAEGRSVNDYKASKQADVLMLLYVLSVDELDDVLTRLGYGLDRAEVPAMIDYYLARTSHGSTLSSVVHAWVLARAHRSEALPFFLDVVDSDVADVQGGTTAEGIHLAAMTGGADLLQRCFAGIEARLDALSVTATWPAGLGTFTSRLRYQGHDLDVRVDETSVRVTSGGGPHRPVTISCRGRHVLEPGAELIVSTRVDQAETNGASSSRTAQSAISRQRVRTPSGHGGPSAPSTSATAPREVVTSSSAGSPSTRSHEVATSSAVAASVSDTER